MHLHGSKRGVINAEEENMANPILVTGAAGRVGAVGRTVTELLLKHGKAARAMVRTEDERAQALRDPGAEVVVRRPARSRFDAQGDCRLRDDILRHVDFGRLSRRHGQYSGGGQTSRCEGVTLQQNLRLILEGGSIMKQLTFLLATAATLAGVVALTSGISRSAAAHEVPDPSITPQCSRRRR